jgi:hypothetical protein
MLRPSPFRRNTAEAYQPTSTSANSSREPPVFRGKSERWKSDKPNRRFWATLAAEIARRVRGPRYGHSARSWLWTAPARSAAGLGSGPPATTICIKKFPLCNLQRISSRFSFWLSSQPATRGDAAGRGHCRSFVSRARPRETKTIQVQVVEIPRFQFRETGDNRRMQAGWQRFPASRGAPRQTRLTYGFMIRSGQ